MTAFPVKTVQKSILAGPGQTPTQLIISSFSNLLFIVVTQTGNIGTVTSGNLYDSKILLGDRMNLVPVVYSNEIEKIVGQKVVLALSLLPELGSDDMELHALVLKGTLVGLISRRLEWPGGFGVWHWTAGATGDGSERRSGPVGN
ncbi:hypothetical protein HDU91_003964 [Kappamyces sp. JEL0680]|nr:hypothetical protein HDU91_003964 [Kappamyces sp. JEL0680]